jgi:hypothetical protein
MPLLVVGLAVGGVLVATGVWNGARLRSVIAGRFADTILPVVREALIGSGYGDGAEHKPSVLWQLEQTIADTADRATNAWVSGRRG